ncbi:unnamed protein product [Moneuplotes crassus]|uniref:folate gamma-glutamyl hydrolase n=1 Tax=Euplotes crassus TaxID=5936 RepID=A0AAD1XKP9_EUPCR|nr:unnamed protein product [Moneuplotes crassus]
MAVRGETKEMRYFGGVKQQKDYEKVTDRPIIGILTCEFDYLNTGEPIESLPNTYSDMLESFGARAVPISFKWPKERIYRALDKVNGVLFTGGDIVPYDFESNEFHPYYLSLKHVLRYVIAKNDQGDYFPLLGICQGIQFLMRAISGNPEIIADSLRWGQNDTFTPLMTPLSEFNMLGNLDIQAYASRNGEADERIEFNWHRYGIYLSEFYKSKELRGFFNVLSYDDYGDGKPIVSTVEAFNYPIIAVQYHPEKNLFDFWNQNIPHTRKAQQFTEDFAFIFIDECKKNSHKFSSYNEEVSALIGNYKRHTGVFGHEGDNLCVDYYRIS